MKILKHLNLSFVLSNVFILISLFSDIMANQIQSNFVILFVDYTLPDLFSKSIESNAMPLSGIGIFLIGLGYFISRKFQFYNGYSLKESPNSVSSDEAKVLVDSVFSNIKISFVNIMKPLSNVASSKKLSKEGEKALSEVAAGASSLLTSINSVGILHDYRSSINTQKQTVSLYNYSREVISIFRYYAKLQNIDLKFQYDIEHEIKVQIYSERLQIVLFNLIFNALKYSKLDSQVLLIVEKHLSTIRFIIRDSGIGFKTSELENVFIKGYRGSEARKKTTVGSGTGLTFVKKEVEELMNGKISIVSEEGKGSDLIIEIPTVEVLTSSNDYVTGEYPAEHVSDKIPKIEQNKIFDEPKAILVVDEDGLIDAEFLDHLSTSYCLDIVMDLNESVSNMEQNQYDLILTNYIPKSDPRYASFCSLFNIAKLKNVKLIYVSNQEKESQSEELDSDSAPHILHESEIHFRLESLIQEFIESSNRNPIIGTSTNKKGEQGDRVNGIYSKEFKKQRTAIQCKEWLERVDNDIEENISNWQYGVEILADNMTISRIHLYRKLKKLTGESPNHYIREKRLLKAKQLIDNKECKTVKEAAIKVGIFKTSYFSQLYFNRFGVMPSSKLHS